MVAVVSVETVLLVVLLILVAGLLRSQAEILRRLGPADAPPRESGMPGPEQARSDRERPAPALAGPTPDGGALSLDFSAPASAPTLLAFLSSGCSTCAGFWEALAESPLPHGVQPVIVTHGTERERPVRVAELAPAGVPVVMSSEAWVDYEVPGSPYFVLVDQSVLGEGSASSWMAVSSLLADALEELGPPSAGGRGGPARTRRVDETLAGAGIGPGHPSLYPAGPPGPEPARPRDP